ncbi:ATP-dependent helicase [Thermoflexus sp.]|uniref:ATP-dependent helicase n=1 Tax=Thermoflexus sp. TaxID=1969742 RepID=UPI0025F9F702|nr:UvrD-helicase domain-containing protein [Thermoflexus sp.]MDW8180946.1 UvrD-helicase domain-containing protein [Anaerolineae bacterium]MCS6963176.1 UvrD-helicase domain-containing protein [Thermoflexus sp.]MCS7351489.1 UvrD-helicase domain-containing protein [Thermoflexus sp.]MCX7689571.1 UvrD-helicase domain-containing protein [Thermoflexus sp.]MDW8185939.1 UvrD-helicase domain-containing protein [Anaerolineae bacterium]
MSHLPPSFFKELNPSQQAAVTAPDGPILVLAGPGSGKTRVLTYRIAYLLTVRRVSPFHILAVTFTNKAAEEMRSRLEALFGEQAAELTLGTFHAICARFLRREASLLGLNPQFVIYDEEDQLEAVRQALRDLNLDEKRYRPGALRAAISRAKNEFVRPDDYPIRTYFDEIAARVYSRYEERLRAADALDFDDLLLRAVELFENHPEALARYQERYRHILVDEFQDTNTVQYLLLRQLASRHRNLFCVGDEDQSIYGWRGADFRNVIRFREHFPDARIIILEENYRSTQTILEAAQSVIRFNTERYNEKRLIAARGPGSPIAVYEAFDEEDEAAFVARRVQELIETRGVRPQEIAVMYRTNAQSRALEEAFVRAGLPYRLVGGLRFYQRREIKDLLAYLRLILNPHDDLSLTRVLNVPPRGIGSATLSKLTALAQRQGSSLFTAIEGISSGAVRVSLSHKIHHALADFAERIQAWRAIREGMGVAELLRRIIDEIGYAEYLESLEEHEPEIGGRRWDNVLELLRVAAPYRPGAFEDPLAAFLGEAALISDVDTLRDDVEAPILLTLHAAKGLEFEAVLITGLEEGLLPHSRSMDDPAALEEERRLFYVGMTRAKDLLVLTYAFRRYDEIRTPSRFLREIPKELLMGPAPRSRRGTWSTRESPLRETPGTSPGSLRFRPGTRVHHPRFGEGLVLESRRVGSDEEVVVMFEEVGLKRLLAGFASLQILPDPTRS